MIIPASIVDMTDTATLKDIAGFRDWQKNNWSRFYSWSGNFFILMMSAICIAHTAILDVVLAGLKFTLC